MKLLLSLLIVFSFAFSQEVPMLINYQAKLTDSSGDPITETIEVTFSFHDAIENGSLIWTETYASLVVNDGIISVLLGSVTPITASHFSGPSVFIQSDVTGYGILAPRQQLTSVPYAIRAENTLKLLHYSISDVYYSSEQGIVIGFDTTFSSSNISEFFRVEIKGSNDDSHYRFSPELWFGAEGNEVSFGTMYILTNTGHNVNTPYLFEHESQASWNIPIVPELSGQNLRLYIQWTTDDDPPTCNFCRGNGRLKEIFIWGK